MGLDFMRWLLIAAGYTSVGLGLAGMFLPLLPTTPFLLLAVVCFAKSSPRLHEWLVSHPRLGSYIHAYRDGRGMPRRAQATTIAVLWMTMGLSAWWVNRPTISGILLGVAVGVTAFILYLTRSIR